MKILIEDNLLIVELAVSEKIMSCKRRLEFNVEHIRSVRSGVPDSRLEMPMLATSIPGVIKAGTYLTREGKEFWFVRSNKSQYITIELSESAAFRRLVLGLDAGEDGFLQKLGLQAIMPVEINH
ncbi:MAG: hypothetical protein V1738_02495 [Patescibacteria group bacterium]